MLSDPNLCDEVVFLQEVVGDMMAYINVSCRALVMYTNGGGDDNTFTELRRWVALRTKRTVRDAGCTRI